MEGKDYDEKDLEREMDRVIGELADLSWKYSQHRPMNYADEYDPEDPEGGWVPYTLIIVPGKFFEIENIPVSMLDAEKLKAASWECATKYIEEQASSRVELESIVASSIYSALLFANCRVTQETVGDIAGVAPKTIQEHYGNMADEYAQVILAELE